MKKLAIGILTLACCATLFSGCNTKRKNTFVETANTESIESNSTSVQEIKASLTEILNRLDELNVRVTALESDECCEDLTSTVSSIESRLELLESNVGGITREGDNYIIEGANLVVRDGSGETECVPGLGNILVGRDEAAKYAEFFGVDPIRTGSNCVVIGGGNQFTGKGGLVVGLFNKLEADGGAVFSCENTVTGEFATVTGGSNNTASGKFSSVSGGCDKTVSSYCGWCAGNFYGYND